jgi:hypothetical protein
MPGWITDSLERGIPRWFEKNGPRIKLKSGGCTDHGRFSSQKALRRTSKEQRLLRPTVGPGRACRSCLSTCPLLAIY